MDTDDIIGLAVFLGLVLIAAAAIAVFRETRRGGPRHRQPRTDTAHVPRQREQPEHQDSGHRPPAPSLRTLTESERAYYENEWARAQERFVDDPAAAVATADRLLAQAMADRGYPVDQPVAPAATVDEYQRVHQAAERGRTGQQPPKNSVTRWPATANSSLKCWDTSPRVNGSLGSTLPRSMPTPSHTLPPPTPAATAAGSGRDTTKGDDHRGAPQRRIPQRLRCCSHPGTAPRGRTALCPGRHRYHSSVLRTLAPQRAGGVH